MIGQSSWCESIIPTISGDKDRAEAISALIIALAKEQPQNAVKRLEEITVFDVRMNCIKQLTKQFKNQKDNLKSIVPYAIEEVKTIDTVLAQLIFCYKESAELIETARVLGVTEQAR